MTTSDDVVDVSPAPRPRGAGRTTAIVVVVAVLLALGGVVAWTATRGGSAGAAGGTAACPTSVAPFAAGSGTASGAALVPATPTASGSAGRLVPDRRPDSVLLCEYAGVGVASAPLPSGVDGGPTPVPTAATTAPVPLSRSANLQGDDTVVRALVTTLRTTAVDTGTYRLCAEPSPGEGPTHLVRLGYDDGAVWLATPTTCQGTTNGVADAPLDLGPGVTDVLDASTTPDRGGVSVEPAPPDTTGMPPVTSGSQGAPEPGTDLPTDPTADPFAACTATEPSVDETALLSITPVTVRVCHAAVDPSGAAVSVTDHDATVAVPLADALLALPAISPDTVCAAIGGETWRLLFTDADSAEAQVDVDAGGCGTASNGIVIAELDDAVVADLTALG